MKKKNKLEKIEAKVCKITDGLAHKDCPDDCPMNVRRKVRREVPINRISKYKFKINRDNLYVHWVVESGFKFKNGKYNIEKALDKCKFISKKFSIAPNPEDPGNLFSEDPYPESDYEKSDIYGRHNIMELRKCINRINEYKKKGLFVFPIKPKPISVKEAYLPSKEYFGSDIKFKRLKDEIENLIARGVERTNKILNKLRKNHCLYLKDEYKNFDIVGNLWDSIDSSKKEKKFIKQKRELDRLLSEHQPLKRKRIKGMKKPFQFNMSQVLVAREMEIITPKESQVLKFRYNLKDQGTKTLMWIAGLLGKSHTTIRNMENNALKKMKEHMSKIKKSIPIKEPLGREATPKEYKEMYGYYPDLGKK